MRYPFKHLCHAGLVLLLLVLVAGSLYAQEGKKNYVITGTVTDARTGEPLIGANVIIEGTTIGAATNAEGKFSILARVEPGAYKITYRFIGYKKQTQDLQLADAEPIDIGQVGLAQDLLQIDEIVVTGTAIATEKERLGNTIATVRGSAVADAIAPTVDAALVGKVAGALVQQNSGTPGGGVSVRLRGTSTISSTAEPLYIVDGVIVDNSSNELVNLGGYVGNRIADLDPNDIDHIEVVKGAAAAALYGSRANNGVIQIFTKRGTAGDTRITYRSRVGTSKIRKTYEVNMFGFDQPPSVSTRRAVTRRDYQKDIFRTGYDVENYLSFSGGSDRTRYYLSGSHEKEEGVMEATNYRKINFRVNLDQTVSNWLQFSANANYINSHSDRVPNGGIVGGEGAITNFAFQPNWFDLRANAEGRFPTPPFAGFANELEVLATWENPLDVNRFIGGLHATATPLRNISIDYTLGYDQYTERAERRIPRGSSAGYTTGFSQSATQDVLLVNNDITATHTIAKIGLDFTTTVGMNHQYFEGNNVTASVRDLIPVAELLSAGATPIATEFQEKRVIYGYFGQETIGYRSKLFLTGALRIDGASTFGKDDRWQAFPKASLSYVLSSEPWWQSNLGSVFNRFKLRGAWGTSGGQPAGSYDLFSVYVQQSNSNRPGLVNSTLLGNANLKPERMREFEIGTDFGMFGDRLSFEFSYYDQRIEDLLLQRTLPPSTGFAGIRDNVGVLSNKGYEILGKALIFNSEKFQWLTTLTASRNKNKVLELNGPDFAVPNSFGIARVATGEPLGIFFGPTYTRDSTGAIILSNGIPVRNPAATKIGDPNPDWTVALVNDFRLGRRLSLHTQFDAVFGNDVFNFTRRILETPAFGNGKEYEKELSGELPAGYFNVRRTIFEEYIEDGSFIKLREVSLGYLLNTGFVRNLGLQSLQLSLSGRNLFSIDDYSGYDPEINAASQSTLVRGFDWSTIPLPRTFSFGITANY
ncbi:SusC/RagA family TonB-linked outer membrane protein [candidate division KSB1 bacterium]|nr:SusC/RagA family TonB-linked outer membrane protein [candidate division KSB1 bacterium]